ncbi:MAG: right-handed parallel beta-helix repeat-containing protein [Planctomycetes bacterium]|nr:right-handed parallel beta-helix repeat-containing protein [Planctomycetota bacterium]
MWLNRRSTFFEYITEVFKYSDKEREMSAKMKQMLITVILICMGLLISDASAMKLTLSDKGLMLLNEYSPHMSGIKATILEKRYIEGVGVEFDIYFPGNEELENSIYYVFSPEGTEEVFKGVDVASCDAFELKFTIVAVDGSTSEENTGILIVGAHMGGAYRPEAISLGEIQPNTAVSTTPMDTDKVFRAGFTAHMLTKKGWKPNGTTVTLLIEPASKDGILVPLDDPSEIIEPTSGIIYVDSNASGADNGSSWTDAFKYLQDGLHSASEGDKIWVADGTYKPDQGENKKKGDKSLSFVLKKGVAIYGGFPLGGGPWEERNRPGNTILSGDLQGNDAAGVELKENLDDKTRSDNSYHVVSASGTNFDTILDGFVIIGGNAKGPSQSSFHKGGGLYFKSGSLTVSNCVFKLNCGFFGGAVCNRDGNPLMFNCNFSKDMGGAVYSSKGSPLIYNCVFILNHAKEKGGAIYNEYNSPIITNCTFFRNIAYAGGGIYCEKSTPIVNNCILWDNSSRYGKLEPSQIYAVEATVGYSCIQGLTESLQGNNNTELDPEFLDAENNIFDLKKDSPCVDAGDNGSLPPELNVDIDGTARLKDGNNDGTVQIDIGAQEF